MRMNELKFEKKLWSIDKIGNIYETNSVSFGKVILMNIMQMQEEMAQLIKNGWMPLNTEKSLMLKSPIVKNDRFFVVQYILSKNTLDNQSNV